MNKTITTAQELGAIRVSKINQYEGFLPFSFFSAKYVVHGSEQYRINHRNYKVNSGEYITGNSTTQSHIIIDSSEPVLGICIDVNPQFIEDIISFQYGAAPELSSFIFEQEGLVNRYNARNTHLGYAIRQIEQQFDAFCSDACQLNAEVFYSLGECIVQDHAQLLQQFQRLNVVKEETSRRLFDFVNDARNYIDRHFLEEIPVSKIASVAHLSEYHFIRLFKKAFQCTPYQYVLHNRLLYAQQLIRAQHKIAEVAFLTGFSDTAAFSKAFKKKFGVAPSLLQ